MKKGLKIALAIAGGFAALVLALQILLDSPATFKYINKLASENIDGELRFSKLKISLVRSFPKVRVTVDSLSITYPHARYSAFDVPGEHDSRLDAGRGAEMDTLAAFDGFTAAINPWPLIFKCIRLSDAELDNLAIYAHDYGDAANWQLFKAGKAGGNGSDAGRGLPCMSIGEINVGQNPRLVYTDQGDSLFAVLGFRKLRFGGKYKVSADRIRIRRALLELDSLALKGDVPDGEFAFGLDRMNIREPSSHFFDLSFSGDALAATQSRGRLEVPFMLDGRIGFSHTAECMRFTVPSLDMMAAHVPMHLAGDATMRGDSTGLSARMDVDGCPLDTLLNEYLYGMVPSLRDFNTDARMNLSVGAEGWLSKDSFPQLKAEFRIPGGHLTYLPLNVQTGLRLDAEATMDAEKVLDASLNELLASTDGLRLELSGKAADMMGDDPAYALNVKGRACLDSLLRFVPESAGIREALGKLNLDLRANAKKSELNTYKFREADILGSLTGDILHVSMPKDSLEIHTYAPSLSLHSSPEGLKLSAGFDSVYVGMGRRMTARVRDMKNSATVVKVESKGVMTPKLSVESDNTGLFLKMGSSRVMAGKAGIVASAQKRIRPDKTGRHPGDSTSGRHRPKFADSVIPEFLQEEDFRKGDIHFSLDSSITRYAREWSPTARLNIRDASYASPVMPLKTRLYGIDLRLTDNNIRIDSLRVCSGTSDIEASGSLSGLRNAMGRRHGVIRTELNVNSERINLNELMAALQKGGKDGETVIPENEYDESFVVDRIDDAQIDTARTPLIIVPANLVARVNLNAGRVDFKDVLIDSLRTSLRMQERTLQMTNTSLSTNYGDIGLEAYYSTKTKRDISTGVDLHLSNLSAYQIIHLLPTVDKLMPALKSFEGTLGCDVSVTTQLDTNMNIVMPTLDGLIKVSGENLQVRDAGKLKRITKLLLFRDKNIGHIDDLHANAVIHDNMVEVFPFEIGVDRYRLALYGKQGFDRTIYYHVSILKTPFLIRFGINIFGTLDNWRFTLGFPKYRNGKVPSFREEIDNVQINIVRSIRNIYKSGVDGVRKYNEESFAILDEGKREKNFKSDEGGEGDLSIFELSEIDDLVIDNDFEQMEKALEDEVDSILEESFKDVEKIMAEYGEKAYDKGISAQIQKLKAQAERRRAAKEARNNNLKK